MKNILFAVLAFIGISHLSFAQITVSEYNALMDLYQSTNGANWTNNTGWSSADPNVVQSVQGWYGVSTNTNGNVTSLYLAYNNLSGSMPQEIGDLVNLTTLYLQGNQLSGAIPPSIGNLNNLIDIDFNSNQLSGNIPSQLGNLSSIQRIHFGNNSLTGSIPSSVGNLATLRQLFLQQNQLSGIIPSEIGSLVNLLNLSLNYNQFSGSIPSSIGSLSSLTTLYLQNNQLSGSIPSSIGNLNNLVDIDLNTNQLSGTIPIELGNLSFVQRIHFGNNSLTGSIPSSVGNLTTLLQLFLQQNQLSGNIPSELGSITNLYSLSLNHNQLSGAIPSSLGSLSSLTTLYLQNNQLSGSIPLSIGSLVNLIDIDINSNQLSGSLPAELGGLSKIQRIHFGNNSITGNIPTSFGNLTTLVQLFLQQNQLTGSIPSGLGSITNLTNLYLNHNKLNGIVPLQLVDLPYLHINSNQFTFSDLVPIKTNYSGTTFYYLPQGVIDSEKTLQAPIGSPYTLTTTIDRNTTPASIYRWYKKVNGVITPLNEASATGHTVELPTITQADNGAQYYYTITNTAAPGLTLTSHLQTLTATTCQVPVLDFQFEEVNGTHTFNPLVSNADNCNITYNWDFGDGTSSQEQVGNHDYAAVGSYTVVLTINYQCGTCPGSTLIKEYVVEIANNVLCQSIYCDGNGGVGIGTRKTQGFALSVYGKIRASDIIKVYPHNQWADFVFDKNYKLRPLSEVELFIKKNGHLPEIPSAAQVEKEGVDLGAMDAKLLQKIEELTLYMIALKKENEQMKQELNTLKEKIKN